MEVQVAYPWVPPTCSHCKELSHVMRNCLHLPPPPKTNEKPAKASRSTQSATGASNVKNKNKTADVDPVRTTKDTPSASVPTASVPAASTEIASSDATTITVPSIEMVIDSVDLPSISALCPSLSSPSAFLSLPTSVSHNPLASPHPALPAPIDSTLITPSKSLSPPDSFYAPSLKRPRPDPAFPSFSAQLSFFTPLSTSKALSFPNLSDPNLFLSPNPFLALDPNGSLHHEETID